MEKEDEIKAKAVIQGEEWARGKELFENKKKIASFLFSIWSFCWWFIVLMKYLIGSPFKLWVSFLVWFVIGSLLITLIRGRVKKIKN